MTRKLITDCVLVLAIGVMIGLGVWQANRIATRNNQIIVDRFDQVYRVMGKVTIKAATSGMVQLDESGIVVCMNDKASALIRLEVGDPVEACMPADMREQHRIWYAEEMDRRKAAITEMRTIVAEVYAPDGTLQLRLIEPWATGNGSHFFLSPVDP